MEPNSTPSETVNPHGTTDAPDPEHNPEEQTPTDAPDPEHKDADQVQEDEKPSTKTVITRPENTYTYKHGQGNTDPAVFDGFNDKGVFVENRDR